MSSITPNEQFVGVVTTLRLVRLEDCDERYVRWLEDGEVNQFLETRWQSQTLERIHAFVTAMINSDDNFLFAILDGRHEHVGNIKLGPINSIHGYADVSYFIGERSAWGKGFATDAIRTVAGIAFRRLALHRVQAGIYESNEGSRRALEKVGFKEEGRFRQQLRLRKGEAVWEDHLWYGLLRSEWVD